MVKAIQLHKGKSFNTKHLLKAIKLLHSNKILHGDIHRGNIVLGTDNLPRLIDFDNGIVDAPTEMIDLEKNTFAPFHPHLNIPLIKLPIQRFTDLQENNLITWITWIQLLRDRVQGQWRGFRRVCHGDLVR